MYPCIYFIHQNNARVIDSKVYRGRLLAGQQAINHKALTTQKSNFTFWLSHLSYSYKQGYIFLFGWAHLEHIHK